MNLSKIEKTELFAKYSNIVNKMAHSFTKSTCCNFNDLKSEGDLAMIRAFEKFDEDKGYCLSTFIYRYASIAMMEFVRKEIHHTPVCYDDSFFSVRICSTAGNTNRQNHVDKYEFTEGLTGMRHEAKVIVDILLSSPAEVLDIALDSSPTKIKVAIKKHMATLGFTKKATLSGINEIKSLLA